MGPLLKLWRSQGKVPPNIKDLLQGLIFLYESSSWWHRVPCLVNIHDAWWIRQSLVSPSSPPKTLALQVPASPPSPCAMCLSTRPLWGIRGASSRLFLRLFPNGQVGAARFVAFCFVGFCNFCDSVEYVNFCNFEILQSMEWPTPDYHNSLVFMNKTGQKFNQVTLLMNSTL